MCHGAARPSHLTPHLVPILDSQDEKKMESSLPSRFSGERYRAVTLNSEDEGEDVKSEKRTHKTFIFRLRFLTCSGSLFSLDLHHVPRFEIKFKISGLRTVSNVASGSGSSPRETAPSATPDARTPRQKARPCLTQRRLPAREQSSWKPDFARGILKHLSSCGRFLRRRA